MRERNGKILVLHAVTPLQPHFYLTPLDRGGPVLTCTLSPYFPRPHLFCHCFGSFYLLSGRKG
jgi:hypothetical protein